MLCPPSSESRVRCPLSGCANTASVSMGERLLHSMKESLMRNRCLSGVTLILSLAIVLSTASNPGGAAAQQAPFFAQDLTLHQTTTSTGKGAGGENKPAQVTTYFSRDAMRSSSGESYDTIIRFGEGKMITIDHKKKTYTELTLQELQDKLSKIGEEMGKNKEG